MIYWIVTSISYPLSSGAWWNVAYDDGYDVYDDGYDAYDDGYVTWWCRTMMMRLRADDAYDDFLENDMLDVDSSAPTSDLYASLKLKAA